MPVPDIEGGGGGAKTLWVSNKFSCIIYTVMVLGSLVEAWGVLGCFDGPHDGYANS